MLKKYKNELYDLIIKEGWIIEDFIPEFKMVEDIGVWGLDTHDMPLMSLHFKDSNFIFEIYQSPENFHTFKYRYTSFTPKMVLPDWPRNFESLNNAENAIKRWLLNIKSFLDEKGGIDLWEQLNNRNKSLDISVIDFDNTEEFNFEEKAQVKLGLNDLKFIIAREFSLQGEAITLVNDRLDYLIDSVERLNKFDWKSVLMSTILSIIIALSLDTERGNILFELFKSIFIKIPQLSH